QIGDKLSVGPALRDCSFRRIVDAVEIDVRQGADQPVRPTGGRESHLLPRHELERSVCSDMDYRVGVENLLNIRVETHEPVMWAATPRGEQPHWVAFVSERWLYPNKDVAQLNSTDQNVTAE